MNQKLTAWHYMHMPIRELIQHPDFDHYKWVRFLAAHRKASELIESALRQGTLEA